ncbi:DUF4144 family protein [Pseudoalteromonas prydzensis]|uniref:DUF4144 family protein n=1 Tax=Pseudoalteromonas prydzensis TaxID=182141 RepID=UPI00186B875E|nr:DUF4144 family protein [Pseudoalteromonas prydzensis]MBE0377809.1 hypothetical protein [Pseudoalteromonas prydzensis ACAM 620]
MPYPKIIIYNEEIELATQASDIDDFLYGMSKDALAHVTMLDNDGSYHTLDGEPCQALCSEQLTHYVKQYLANEGHCCLSKIEQLTAQQAFNLLVID